MKVFAHTSKVGYYTSRSPSFRWTTNEYGTIYWSVRENPTTAVSFKSPTQWSDGRKPTNYSRIIIRGVGRPFVIEKIRPPKGKHGGDNSFLSSGHVMRTNPWGQNSLASGSVHPPLHLRANAISQCVSRMHGEQAFILEDLAQSAQTARQLYDTAKLIVSKTGSYLAVLYSTLAFYEPNFGKVARRSPKHARSSPDAAIRRLAKAWLAWYYGIKPLISTINTIAKADTPRVKRLRVKSRQTESLDPRGLFNQPAAYYNDYVYSGSCKAETTCVMMVDVSMSTNIAQLAKLGFRPGTTPEESPFSYNQLLTDADGLRLLWALIPYSFVIDWLIPVDKLLSQLVWSPSITYKGGFITDFMGGHAVIKDKPWDGYRGTFPESRVDVLLFQREDYSDWVPPSVLAVNQGISPMEGLNAIALLASR